MPPIYAVDSSVEEDWEKNVRLPSSELVSSFLQVLLDACHFAISVFMHKSSYCFQRV